jgi:hypothetical protein
VKLHPGAGNMKSGSSRYRSALVREDAYFSEIDQILLANLRETLELKAEAQECAAGNSRNCGLNSRHSKGDNTEVSFADSDQFASSH